MGTWLSEHAIALAISLIGGFVATFLAKKAGVIMDAIEAKLNIDIDDKVEERIQQIIRKVVLAIAQTFVTGLKERGEFDDAKKKEALDKAIKEAGQIIRDELGINLTKSQLRTAIEAELGEQKQIEKVVGGASEPKRYIKKRKR